MPCSNAGHSHVWPTTGPLFIERCERYCQFCTGEDAAKEWKFPWFLRRHVRAVHVDSGQYPQAVVDDSWYVSVGYIQSCRAYANSPFRDYKKPRGVRKANDKMVKGRKKKYGPADGSVSDFNAEGLPMNSPALGPGGLFPYSPLYNHQQSGWTGQGPLMAPEFGNNGSTTGFVHPLSAATYAVNPTAFSSYATDFSNDDSFFHYDDADFNNTLQTIFNNGNMTQARTSTSSDYSPIDVTDDGDIGASNPDTLTGFDVGGVVESIEPMLPTTIDPVNLIAANDNSTEISEPNLDTIFGKKAKPRSPDAEAVMKKMFSATREALTLQGIESKEVLYGLQEFAKKLAEQIN